MNVQEELLRKKIDPALTDTTLQKILGEAGFPKNSVQGYRILTGGCWNRVIEFRDNTSGRRFVLKISPEEENGGIKREARILTLFSEKTGMPVPEPYLCDTSGGIIPGSFLLMERIKGSVMHQASGILGTNERTDISREIGTYVAELHKHKDTGFGGAELPPEERAQNWPVFWLPRYDRVLRESADSGVVDRGLIVRAEKIRPFLQGLLEIGREGTLTHYDIWAGNVMIDRSEGGSTVSGFIDVSGFYADYARELSFMLMFGLADDHMMKPYLAEHSLDDTFNLRVNIYNLKMHLKHITMYPGQLYYRRGAEECLHYIEIRI
ncbi:MAG: phosphotransferase [Spirochaetia bacterium]